MPDWTASMQQSFEYYIVDPNTWKDKTQLKTVKSSSISRDSEVATLGSATFDVTESVGECYIRVYLITIQNGVTEKHPLGTYLVQTPAMSFDGMVQSVSLDAYTPLIELNENPPTLGYSILKNENIMDNAYMLARENARAPIVKATSTETLFYDFVANTDDTWLTFLKDLTSNARFELSLDEMGRILFSPKQNTASLQPVWTFDDGNSSILMPNVNMERDLYGIPNVVEVIYSNGSDHYYAKVVNDDPNSPISTIARGRELGLRITDPDLIGNPTGDQIQEYAENTLKSLSTLEFTVTYSHAYCPVRVGDCVRLNYNKAGLTNINAKVVSQSIKCDIGCEVSERAVFTTKLWR